MNGGSLNGNAPHTYSWKLAQTQQTEGRQKCRGPQLMMMMMMMTKEEHLFYNNSLSSRRTFCHPPLPLHLSNSRLDGESTWSSSYSIICLCFLAGHNSTQHRERMKVDGWMDGSFSIRIIYKQLIVAHNRIFRLSTVHCLCHSVCSSSGSAD